MRVEVSPEAMAFVKLRGGRVWVWAARPAMCCAGTPSFMHAATQPPRNPSGFHRVPAPVDLWFRSAGGLLPAVLEVGLRGRRRPHLEAYWDGCLFALNA
jgi:hypothetical protein